MYYKGTNTEGSIFISSFFVVVVVRRGRLLCIALAPGSEISWRLLGVFGVVSQAHTRYHML